eukprot:TRINITY_DN5781_c0_g1_i1.p1 TRINITY_DN5781_c0_g1~~TRINITY_DN5781_c0_g1_i1.p1  ORF type:complete len:210 (+),score=20.72 TRINITY_DN5781_c0_g1_i1:161-790(+)
MVNWRAIPAIQRNHNIQVDQGLEGGVRPAKFARWATDHETMAMIKWGRYKNAKPLEGADAYNPPPNRARLADPISDHGVIYPGLHDIHLKPLHHRGKEPGEASGSQSGVRLPSVSASPYGDWHSFGANEDFEGESAVTAVTTAISASAPRRHGGAASRLSACASAPGLGITLAAGGSAVDRSMRPDPSNLSPARPAASSLSRSSPPLPF